MTTLQRAGLGVAALEVVRGSHDLVVSSLQICPGLED